MVKEVAVFGAGCFWHVQRDFDSMKGVTKTEVGFMGGAEKKENYSYEEVCSGGTGHVEVCRVEFDNKKISYEDLLEAYWSMHDPTQVDRQGLDIGEQYRSVVFYTSSEQKKIAESSKEKLQKELDEKKVATSIVKAGKFYKAEEYHQRYLEKKGLSTCPA